MDREQLIEQTNLFMAAFNRNDLDAVMSFFAKDAVYDEFNGKSNHGKVEIRAAFLPQFSGAFGKMQFLDEDLFIDADSGKVMASWRCRLVVKGKPTAWRGLDLLHFQGNKLIRKITYAKTKAPLFEE